MKSFLLLITLVLLLIMQTACDDNKSEPEDFDDTDITDFVYNSESNYYLCDPWNYNKDSNADRKYPLIVYLHGISR